MSKTTRKRRRDWALESAREILEKTVCECGHLASDHVYGEPPNECHGAEGDCACPQFQPVAFTVERA